MSLYAFKVIEKMLTHHEKEQELKLKKSFFSKKDEQPHQAQNRSFNKNKSEQHKFSKNEKVQKGRTLEKKEPDNNRAYCLFAKSGDTFLAMHMGEKKNISLFNISHPNKYHPLSKQANTLINENIKTKNVFLTIKETLENGDLIAEVFLDKEKTKSLNQILINDGLDKSEEIKPMSAVEEKTTDMTESKSFSEPLQNKPKQKNTFEHVIGYLVNHGYAPYQNKPGSSKSYFVELEVNDEKQTRWGIDFARAIRAAKVSNGDYIEIKKSDTPNDNGGKRVSWNIIKKDDLNALSKKQDGLHIATEEPTLDIKTENVFEAPEDWSQEPMIDWDTVLPLDFLGDTQGNILEETEASTNKTVVLETTHIEKPLQDNIESINQELLTIGEANNYEPQDLEWMQDIPETGAPSDFDYDNAFFDELSSFEPISHQETVKKIKPI